MQPSYATWLHHLEIVSRPFGATGKGNIAFALTTSGAFALLGAMETRSRSKLLIITNREKPMPKTQKLLPAIHPGEILRADFMEPLRLSMNRLALDLRVPVTRIAEIVHERRGITPDTALRLARYFNTSAAFWMNLQTAYDLEVAEDALAATINREVRPATVVASTS